MVLKQCLVLFLASNLVLSHSGNNVFMKTEVPKSNTTTTKPRTESIKNLEKLISSKLRVIRNDELLVPIVQAEVESWTFSENFITDVEIIEKISASISAKVQPAIKIIKEICAFLTNKEHKRQIFYSLVNPCPHNDKIDIRINHFYNDIYHNNNFSGEIDILNDRNLIFHNYLLENIGKAGHGWQSYRQYFLSTSDQAKIENCNNVPEIPHFTRLYTDSIANKKILLLIDQTSEQMEITRAIAKTMISSLSENDSVAVILIANKAVTFTMASSCSKDTAMVSATSSVKAKIYDFLDNANRTNGIANHTLGFQMAFEVLDRVYKESSGNLLPITFLYVSEGITTLFSDARNVLAEMTIGQSKLPYPVVINTIAVIANNRQNLYQTQFLQDITMQNYNKYSIDTSAWWSKKGDRSLFGQMIVVNRTMENLGKMPVSIVTDLFKNKNFINNQLTIHPPYFDADFSSDFIVSITKNCEQRGVFGIDLMLNYLIEDVLYSNTNNSYKFLVDMRGFALAHSKFYPRPVTLKQSFHPVHITLLEKNKGFNESVWQQMKNNVNGSVKINEFSYTWSQINDLLIVCIVTNLNERRPNVLHKIKTQLPQQSQYLDQSKHLSELIYHRLDLNTNSIINVCQYYKQIATFDAITLHLSSKTFASPYAQMSRGNGGIVDENQMIQNFMAYLRDTRNLFANPGLVDGVRQEVSGIYQIMESFKKKHIDSELRKYVIRRYVAGVNGVLQVFPGCSLDDNFEATRRPWYVKAIESKGKIAITEPYLDAAGAGYIVSVSFAIYEKRFSPNNRINYQPVIVVSMDFTRGFFYKILLDSLPVCSYDDIKCFLMDDKGYLIAHKNILEPTSEHFRQPEHITHKESHVANDILMQRKFVEKIACNNYLNGTSQRFYQFNTSINEVITNYANVEKTKYQLVSLKNTNIFVGIINSSSETSGAFCPCSTIDYRCLNCFRMEQNECECPCECRLDLDDDFETCIVDETPKNENSTMCQQQIEYISSYQPTHMKENVDSCNLFNCDMFSEKEDCLGVVGCIWCHTNDDETPLSIPFCAVESTCYNGMFGSLGDGYSNIVIDPVMNYNLLPPTYSIILPVIGVILLLFLVVGFALYCYRINYDNNGFGEHLYIDNGSMDNNCIGMMQMSRFDYDDPPIDEQMGSNLNQSLLNANENAIVSSIQSPYRIATNYRHPNGYTDSSDHGYSTMGTHQDESEPHASISNRGNKRFSLSDSASVNTSISSPQHTQPYDISMPSQRQTTSFYPPSDQTILSPKKLSPHQVIAEVTVHRLMD